MAEFGIQATELSAPQGAGSRPVSPVTTGILDNGVLEGISNIASIFQKGLENDARAKEKAFSEGILKGYASEQGAISEAVTSGGLTADAAARRSRIVFNKYIASYPQFEKELSGLRGAFQAGTETGSAFEQVKDEASLRKELIGKMQGKGFPVSIDQPKAVQDAWIGAYQTEERMQEQFTREQQRKEAMRAEGRWNEEVEKGIAKKRAERDLGELGFQQLEAIFITASDYSNRVRTGALDSTQARLNVEQQFSEVLQKINLVGAANPELAGMYRGMFERAREAAVASLDPNLPASEVKAKADLLLNEARLRMLNDPKTANTVAVSQAFGNAPELVSKILGVPTATLDRINAMMVSAGTSNIPVVTGTDSDKITLDVIKSGIKAIQTGKAKDKDASVEESTNMVRNYLSQYGKLSNISPAQLKDSTQFFASVEFGNFVKENAINSAEIKPARDAFQMHYEGPVLKAVQESFSKFSKGMPSEAVGVSFDGTSVRFTNKLKGVKETSGTVLQNIEQGRVRMESERSVKTLEDSAAAINQLIRAGAHMEGTTDYAAYFEKEKHNLLPQFFSAYEGLEIGQVVNGKRYVGGDAKSPSSWKDASGS